MPCKSTEKKLPSGLHSAYCDNCNRYLCGAPVASSVYCPACSVWSVVMIETEVELQND